MPSSSRQSGRPLLGAAVGVLTVLAVLAVPAGGAPPADATTVAAESPIACPEPDTKQNFDLNSYLGKWYEVQRVARAFEKGGQCGTVQYSLNEDKSGDVNVVNKNFLPQSRKVYTVNLLATPQDQQQNGRFEVTWPDHPDTKFKYWVLDTNYVNYSVVYSCGAPNETQKLPSVTLWVLSRSQALEGDALDSVKTALEKSTLPLDGLEDVQQHCPEAACAGECKAKGGLDLGKIKGRWWEIKHSPFSALWDQQSLEQSCSLVDLSVTDAGLKVDGYAAETVGTSPPGTKDKNITLEAKWRNATSKAGAFHVNIAGDKDGLLCVVDTDYDNWAVVSACGGKPGKPPKGLESVPYSGLWVLSRQRGLSAHHQLKANQAVISAGLPALLLQNTPASPCPAKALEPQPSGGARTATARALMLVAATIARMLPAQ